MVRAFGAKLAWRRASRCCSMPATVCRSPARTISCRSTPRSRPRPISISAPSISILCCAAWKPTSGSNLVFLDACRDNPLARNLARSSARGPASVGSGLAQIQSAVGTLIAYATQPDNVALDGDGRNSPFTAALLKHIATPGLEISALMKRVRADVIVATRAQAGAVGSFLADRPVLFQAAAEDAAAARAGQEGVEVTFWNSIKDTRNPQLF